MKRVISIFIMLFLAFDLNIFSYAMIPAYVASVEINCAKNITMYIGDEIELEAIALPRGVDYAYFLWITDTDSIITITGDDGTTRFEPANTTATIKAIRVGTVVVTVYSETCEPYPDEYTPNDSITINVIPREVTASSREFSAFSYNNNNQESQALCCVIDSLNDDIVLNLENISMAPEQSLYDSEYDKLVLLDLKSTDENNPYPSIEQTTVKLGLSVPDDETAIRLGKYYKVFLMEDGSKEQIEVTEIDGQNISFNISKLGKYVVYFDEFDQYAVTFYNDIPPVNSEEQEYIYHKTENLKADDIVVFPEIPQKENHVFAGWKAQTQNGISFTQPQPFTALENNGKYYASWCPKDRYEPIKLELSSNGTIIKGNENGSIITLKTNYGIFANHTDFSLLWKSQCNIVGSNDLSIESVTRIDDKTIEFTLSGNSIDKYNNSDIYIEFDSSLLMPEPYEQNGIIIDWDDTKIITDTDGVRAKKYVSDNAITLIKQSRPSIAVDMTSYLVTFDTNGGSAIPKQTVNKNGLVKQPEQPHKEEYNFVGWYTDKGLAYEFDFVTKVTKNITLYAKWEVEDVTKNQLIFTIGNTQATVFGQQMHNDVCPIIKNNRAFLPARFVAENLGAVVEWDNETRTVTITKDDIIIIITIGQQTAIVNGEAIQLDSPAFIEKNRTYTPIRFIAENLGSNVEWNPDGKIITITK